MERYFYRDDDASSANDYVVGQVMIKKKGKIQYFDEGLKKIDEDCQSSSAIDTNGSLKWREKTAFPYHGWNGCLFESWPHTSGNKHQSL